MDTIALLKPSQFLVPQTLSGYAFPGSASELNLVFYTQPQR